MAFPVVAARITGRTTNTNTTTHAITLPTGVVTGNLLVVVFSTDGNPTVTAQQAGWTKLNQASSTTVVTGAIFWKVATGSDALTLVTSVVEASSHASFRITGGGTPTATSANGTTANSDPPAHTPPAGLRDYLWIATRSADSTNVATVAPASYANLQTQAATGTGGASTNTAERSLATATENPGTFTSTAIGWVAWTISVPPADQSAVMDPVASSASVALPTVVVPQVRSMAVVAATSTVATPTVPTHYPALVASTASVATPAVAKQTSTPALVASTAAVPTVTTKLTVTAAPVASTASVATPTVIGTQVVFLAPVASTATVATPTVATHYPTFIASTATVTAPTVATHYPVTIGSTTTVPAPTVVVWLRPTTVVNRPALRTTSTSLAPSTSLLPSLGGDRFFPPTASVNLRSTHLPQFVASAAVVNMPEIVAGEIVAAVEAITPSAAVGEVAGIDTVTQHLYPRALVRGAIPSPVLAPSTELVPTSPLSEVYPPQAWVGHPQSVTVEPIASTAAVAGPVLSFTEHPLTLSHALVSSLRLAPSTGLVPTATAGLSTVFPPSSNTNVLPLRVAPVYPGDEIYPSEAVYPATSPEVLAPSVQLGIVRLSISAILSGSTVGVPTPSGSGVNFVPLILPVTVTNAVSVADPTVWVEPTAIEIDFLDTEEAVQGPNIVLQGETLALPDRVESLGTIPLPFVLVGTAQIRPALVLVASAVLSPRIVALQAYVVEMISSRSSVGLPRVRGRNPPRDPHTVGFTAGPPSAPTSSGLRAGRPVLI